MRSSSPRSDDSETPLQRQAAEWLVRREAGWSAADAAAFAAWCAADPRHAAAVAQLERTHRSLGRLSELPATSPLWDEVEALTRPKARVLRYPVWARGLAAAIALGALIFAGRAISTRSATFADTYLTEQGMSQRLVLPDGSQVQLHPATALEVRYSRGERLLHLPRGEAHFEVIRDPARPFLVTAGPVAVRAVGTAFTVRHRDATVVEVLVTEGEVRVEPQTSAASRTPHELLLRAGERLAWDTRYPGGAADVAQVQRIAAPADDATAVPRLTFTDTPLAQAVAEFNRHNQVQLEIGDPALADRAVGGTFSANGAESFASLLAAGGDIRLERPAPNRIVLRQAP